MAGLTAIVCLSLCAAVSAHSHHTVRARGSLFDPLNLVEDFVELAKVGGDVAGKITKDIVLAPVNIFEKGMDFLTKSPDPEINMNATQIIERWGYPTELHHTTTEDGYILAIVRVPHGKGQKKEKNRPVVYMQHGLEDSCNAWIMNLPHQSAAYMFADAGYDVWLGNFRGSTYSRNHITYKNDSKEFWNFSWDEMAHYDLPAMIKYVLKTSGQKRLHYIGHSMGTTTAFAQFSDPKSEIAKSIITVQALGPVGTLNNASGAAVWLAKKVQEKPHLLDELRSLKNGEFPGDSAIFKGLTNLECGRNEGRACLNAVFFFTGLNQDLNKTRVPVYFAHSPGGTSVNTVNHYLQEINDKKFQYYDFGADENMKRYNQTTPPEYDLTKFVPPLYLWYGQNDTLATSVDAENYLAKTIPNVKLVKEIEKYSHMDFEWGQTANEKVYQPILDIIADLK